MEIDVLISHYALASSPAFKTWNLNVRRFLANKYGKDSLEYNEFEKIHFQMTLYTASTPTSLFVEKCQKGLLEPVHIKIASKIIAKEIKARKTISSLS